MAIDSTIDFCDRICQLCDTSLEDVVKVVANHTALVGGIDGYYATKTRYDAHTSKGIFRVYEEVTPSNAPLLITETCEEGQYEGFLRKVCLIDYERISKNFETLPDYIIKILLSEGVELPIDSRMYKDMLMKFKK